MKIWRIAANNKRRNQSVKQIAQYQDGRLELQEVPIPALPPGGILVRLTHSVISVGTEKMKVEQAKMNLLQKARARPDQVRKVLDTARNLGWKSALEKVRNRLATPTPLGYSAAGVVEKVDELNTRFRAGDRVACGGAECAFHAEYIAIPDLLATHVPDGVEGWQAAYTTVASIALQAVRQAEPRLGDKVLVLGQGLIGLLITNLLALQGARVMAVDLLESRRSFCLALGAENVVVSTRQDLAEEVRAWTEGYGADIAVVCTATQSNAPIEQAADALRDRGRMLIVGNTKTDLAWKVFYGKEIEVRYSRSYGPGRYDPAYEWGGSDYPVGYVRWTEQRNFDACLHLMRTGQLKLGEITTRRVPFAESLAVYESLTQPNTPDIGVVIEYPAASRPPAQAAPKPAPAVLPGRDGEKRLTQPVERLDVIGAGNFARTMLLPHVQGKIPLGTIVNQTSLSANHVKTKFGFTGAATDYRELLKDRARAAVLVATRHHLHCPIVLAALAAGRQVFVEKPLCLSSAELAEIDQALANSLATVQVGFNRRFAPASVQLKAAMDACVGPKTCVYKVNAGRLDPAHWYANPAESGGRVVGEACHFFDLFCFLFDQPPVRVFAQTTWPAAGRLPFPDSVAAQVEFADGSCGQLVYSAEGDSSYPKETLTVFAAGLVGEIVNFQSLSFRRGRKERKANFSSKGHAEQMAAWLAFLQGTADHPLPYAAARQSMRLTFAALESIRQGQAVTMG